MNGSLKLSLTQNPDKRNGAEHQLNDTIENKQCRDEELQDLPEPIAQKGEKDRTKPKFSKVKKKICQ